MLALFSALPALAAPGPGPMRPGGPGAMHIPQGPGPAWSGNFRPILRPTIGNGPFRPYPHNYYYHHDRSDNWKNVAIGAGIGLLLGAIANSAANSNDSASVSQAQQALQDEADRQTQKTASLISQQGVNGALSTIQSYWRSQGQRAVLAQAMPLSILTVSGFQQPDLQLSYSVNTATSEVSVTASNPANNLSAVDSSAYTIPSGSNPFATNFTQTAY